MDEWTAERKRMTAQAIVFQQAAAFAHDKARLLMLAGLPGRATYWQEAARDASRNAGKLVERLIHGV